MSIVVTHPFVSAKADGVDPTIVQPSNWNADHKIQLSSGNVIGRLSSGTGDAEEIPILLLGGERNRAINGNQVVDQRHSGASVTLTNFGQYVTDRFFCGSSGLTTQTISAQQVDSNLANYSKSLKVTVGTGAAPAASAESNITYVVEGTDWADLKWGTASAQPISVRFVVISSVTGTFGFAVRNAGTRSYIRSFSLVAGVETEIKLENIPGCTDGVWSPDSTGGIRFTWDLGAGTTLSNSAGSWITGDFDGLSGGTKLIATSGATFEMSGFNINKGTKCATPQFKSYGATLDDCFRYCYAWVGIDLDTIVCRAQILGSFTYGMLDFPKPLRKQPNFSAVGNFGTTNETGSVNQLETTDINIINSILGSGLNINAARLGLGCSGIAGSFTGYITGYGNSSVCKLIFDAEF